MPKISGLPAASSVTTADLVPIVQGGTTKEAPLSLVASSPTMISSNVDATTMAVTDTFNILQGGVVKEASLSLLPAWTVSTAPTVGATVGTITAATTSLRYLQLGKTVFFSLTINITNNGTGSVSLTVAGLPVAGKTGVIFPICGRDFSATGKAIAGHVSSTNMLLVNYDNSYPGAVTNIIVGGVYEAQ